MKNHRDTLLRFLVLAPLLGGCASVIHGRTQEIELRSTPGDARYEVRDLRGNAEPISGTTPGKVKLDRGAGFFKGGKYEVTVSKNGYAPVTLPIGSEMNMTYGVGNVVLGGLIGWLIVDPGTGAMWKLDPGAVNVVLGPVGSGVVAAAPAPVPYAAPPTVPAATAVMAPPPAVAAMPAATAAPVVAATSAAVAGSTIRLAGPLPFRDAPLEQRQVKAMLPAGTEVLLRNRMTNAEGDWWFVQTQSGLGWIPALP